MRRLIIATISISLIIGILVGFLSSSMLISRVTVTERFTYTYTSKTVYTTTIRHTETVTITKSESEIKYARLFKVTEFDDYKIVKDALNRTLILVPRNKSPPIGVEGIVIYVPVERVILMSATQVALLMRLKEYRPDILDTVVGIMWGGQYEWYFKDVDEALISGRIKDVGAPETPNYEEILTLNPDIVFIYAFPGMEAMSKFDELGIKYAVINEYLENDYLGRFEWIKFVASFYGLDSEAKEIFNKCEQTISSIARKVADRVPPNVAWFSIYKGTVYAAGGESYVAKALRQLNARYIFSDVKQTSSFVTTLEEILGHAGEIDVIVYPGIVSSLSDILAEAPGLSETNAVKQKRVYTYSPMIYQLGFYDVEGWYLDLAYILHPEEFPEHQLRYFINIAE
ncbi:MAG: ABC transporter substrate-binding protein [Nitrososphaerota archaeon]